MVMVKNGGDVLEPIVKALGIEDQIDINTTMKLTVIIDGDNPVTVIQEHYVRNEDKA